MFFEDEDMFGNMVFILHACCAVVSVFELSFCMRCACQVKVGFVVNSFSQDENREALTTTHRFGFLERSQNVIPFKEKKTLTLASYSQQMLVFLL